jgi:hypothetical protein
MKSFKNLFILFFILIVLGFLYKRFEDKRIREENKDVNEAIQNYLLEFFDHLLIHFFKNSF